MDELPRLHSKNNNNNNYGTVCVVFVFIHKNYTHSAVVCVVFVNKRQSQVVQTLWVSYCFRLGSIRGSHFDNKCFKDTIDEAFIYLLRRWFLYAKPKCGQITAKQWIIHVLIKLNAQASTRLRFLIICFWSIGLCTYGSLRVHHTVYEVR